MSFLEQLVEEWLFWCRRSPMASSLQEAEILEAAVTGIPRVAQAIAAISPQHRDSALRAAERCYLQTARDLGGAEKFAQNWVSAVMLRLQAEVEQRVSANRNRLKVLHAELVRAESADVQEFREIRQRRWRMRGDRFSRSLVVDVPSAVTMATRELRFSIRAGTVPMFGFMPFPADRFDRQAESRCRPSVNVGPVAHDSKIAAD